MRSRLGAGICAAGSFLIVAALAAACGGAASPGASASPSTAASIGASASPTAGASAGASAGPSPNVSLKPGGELPKGFPLPLVPPEASVTSSSPTKDGTSVVFASEASVDTLKGFYPSAFTKLDVKGYPTTTANGASWIFNGTAKGSPSGLVVVAPASDGGTSVIVTYAVKGG